MHHELLVVAEEELEARQIGVLIIGQLPVLKKLRHQGLHLRVTKGERASESQAGSRVPTSGALPCPSLAMLCQESEGLGYRRAFASTPP